MYPQIHLMWVFSCEKWVSIKYNSDTKQLLMIEEEWKEDKTFEISSNKKGYRYYWQIVRFCLVNKRNVGLEINEPKLVCWNQFWFIDLDLHSPQREKDLFYQKQKRNHSNHSSWLGIWLLNQPFLFRYEKLHDRFLILHFEISSMASSGSLYKKENITWILLLPFWGSFVLL